MFWVECRDLAFAGNQTRVLKKLFSAHSACLSSKSISYVTKYEKKSQPILKILYFTAYSNKEKYERFFFLNDVQKSDDGDAIDDNIKNMRGRGRKKLLWLELFHSKMFLIVMIFMFLAWFCYHQFISYFILLL